MSGKLAWGILGTGAIAQTFARGLKQATAGTLAAVGSRAQATAAAFGAKFGLPAGSCHGSYDALLADPGVAAVYIGLPHPEHAQWAIRAAEAGKHILVEKPMAVNYAQALAIVDAARRHKVFVMEAFMYRCHPQTAKLVELIRAGEIGQVRLIHSAFSFQAGFNPESRLFKNDLAGGGILDVGCYPVSLCRLIAGAAQGADFADPTEVKGVAHLGATGVDEWAAAVLKFPGDIVAEVSTGVAVTQDYTATIVGSSGRIVIPNPWVGKRDGPAAGLLQVSKNGQPMTEAHADAPVTSFTLEADRFAASLERGAAIAPALTPEDSLGNMATLDRWRESAGLVYEIEKPEHPRQKLPLHGRPLAAAPGHNMKYGQIPGLTKPVARLIMGVDNQGSITATAVMFDGYFERGGNVFDTAYIYGAGGRSEKLIGHWVRNRGVREQVVILDKGAHTPHCNPEGLTRQFLESLERLQTDYVDLYMMHRDNPEVPVGEFIDVLNAHLKAGRMRAFGPSNWSLERVKKANAYAKRKGLVGFAGVSNNLSLARMVEAPWAGCMSASDPEWRGWLKRTQTPLLPWSSQARGFFTDRAGPDQHGDKELERCWYSQDNFARRARAVELAERRGVQPIQIALAYVLCQPFPTFPLIGPRRPAETESSFKALEIELSPKEVKWLNLED
jgi:predicted dehydrogenase/aryl-alcohol dehydrogenase-like predicted oxidoreductase